MEHLKTINSINDIPTPLRKTPVGLLIEYQNLNRVHDSYNKAQLVLGTCIDSRIRLNLPNRFAYIVRTGGANMKHCEFYISFALAMEAISHIAVIGHSDCGMIHLNSKKEKFVKGMTQIAGWEPGNAEEHFNHMALTHEICNVTDFTLNEADRLQTFYPKILVTPLFYDIESAQLYLISKQSF